MWAVGTTWYVQLQAPDEIRVTAAHGHSQVVIWRVTELAVAQVGSHELASTALCAVAVVQQWSGQVTKLSAELGNILPATRRRSLLRLSSARSGYVVMFKHTLRMLVRAGDADPRWGSFDQPQPTSYLVLHPGQQCFPAGALSLCMNYTSFICLYLPLKCTRSACALRGSQLFVITFFSACR